MNILLISTFSDKLSEREFVHPIADIVNPEKYKILHYKECNKAIVSEFDKLLLCGTSLQDNQYQKDLEIFKELLSDYDKPVLGICSGMQIVASIFEERIVENVEIGMIDVQTLENNELCEGDFQAYSLHNYSVDKLKFFEVLARSETSVQSISHNSKQIFGVSFHPEVRNNKIIDNFLRI